MGKARDGRTAAEVALILRERISGHQLPPGSKLQEVELAEEFDVSRACIREVLGFLEQRRLIRREPNRGAVVVRLEVEQVFALYEVREMLEGLCARLAAEKADPASWQDLTETFDGPMARYVEDANVSAFVAELDGFRRRLVTCAANPVLSDALDSIRDQTKVIIRRIIVLPGRMATGLAEHRATLAALRAGDPDEAERCARANIRSAKSFLKRFEAYVL